MDAGHVVSIQTKYEALNSSVADYFKRVAVSTFSFTSLGVYCTDLLNFDSVRRKLRIRN